MGAVVSFLLAADRPEMFAGIVCLSPAFASRYRPAFSDAFDIFAHLLYDTNKQFKLPFDSAMCTRDAEYRKKMDGDRREYRTVPARLLLEILRMQFAAKNLGNDFRVPALFLVSGEDKIADPAAAEAIFSALKVKDKTFMEFPEMYHSLSIEVGKESVFEEILKWVERRI